MVENVIETKSRATKNDKVNTKTQKKLIFARKKKYIYIYYILYIYI